MYCFLSEQCFPSTSTTTNCLQTKDLVQILRKSDVATKEAAAIKFAIKCDECRARVNQTLSAALPTVISGLDMPPWYFAIHCTESFTNLHFTYRPLFWYWNEVPILRNRWFFMNNYSQSDLEHFLWYKSVFFSWITDTTIVLHFTTRFGLISKTVLFLAFSDRDLSAKIGNEWMKVFKSARWNEIDEKYKKKTIEKI